MLSDSCTRCNSCNVSETMWYLLNEKKALSSVTFITHLDLLFCHHISRIYFWWRRRHKVHNPQHVQHYNNSNKHYFTANFSTYNSDLSLKLTQPVVKITKVYNIKFCHKMLCFPSQHGISNGGPVIIIKICRAVFNSECLLAYMFFDAFATQSRPLPIPKDVFYTVKSD